MSAQHKGKAASLREFLAQVNLIDLALFDQAARELSVSKAAQNMDDMLESTASKRLRRLEKLLDSRLFERTTRHMSLTEPGKSYLNQINVVLNALDDLYRMTTVIQTEAAGELKVAADPGTVEFLCREFISRFIKAHPDIYLDMRQVNYDEVDDSIRENDLVISAKLPTSQSVGLRSLGTFQVYFWASPEYLAAHGTPKHPRDLAHHHFLTSRNKVFGEYCIPWQDRDGVIYREPIAHPVYCDSYSSLLSLAAQGIGVIVTTPVILQDRQDDFQLLFQGEYGLPFEVYAIFPSARLMPRKTALFLSELEAYYDSLPKSL